MTRKHTPLTRFKHTLKTQAALNKRKVKRKTMDGTDRYSAKQHEAQERAVTEIMALGYSEARARKGVADYATASERGSLVPDWEGFIELVTTYGFADD